MEAEKKLGNYKHSCYFQLLFLQIFISHLLSACEGGHPLLHRPHSPHILHQFKTMQISTELFLAFAYRHSLSLSHTERHLQPTLIAVCDMRFRNAPLQNLSSSHRKQHHGFTLQSSSRPLLSSPLLHLYFIYFLLIVKCTWGELIIFIIFIFK